MTNQERARATHQDISNAYCSGLRDCPNCEVIAAALDAAEARGREAALDWKRDIEEEARAEGRKAGLEEAAILADGYGSEPVSDAIATAIRALAAEPGKNS